MSVRKYIYAPNPIHTQTRDQLQRKQRLKVSINTEWNTAPGTKVMTTRLSLYIHHPLTLFNVLFYRHDYSFEVLPIKTNNYL